LKECKGRNREISPYVRMNVRYPAASNATSSRQKGRDRQADRQKHTFAERVAVDGGLNVSVAVQELETRFKAPQAALHTCEDDLHDATSALDPECHKNKVRISFWCT
jgi:hypothetical protein